MAARKFQQKDVYQVRRSAHKDLPILQEQSRKLLELVKEGFQLTIAMDASDHFGFMGMCFIQKQIEHSVALEMLIQRQLISDASITARVMLEGMVYLGWAGNDKHDRALAWRSFALIYDWETLMERKRKGDPIDPLQEAQLKERIRNEAPRFFTKGARNRGIDSFDNPYQKTWTYDSQGQRVDLPAMMRELGDPNLKVLYDDLSQLMHWTVRGIGPLISLRQGAYSLNPKDVSNAARACMVGLIALMSMAQVVAEHFDLPLQGELQDFDMQYRDALLISD